MYPRTIKKEKIILKDVTIKIERLDTSATIVKDEKPDKSLIITTDAVPTKLNPKEFIKEEPAVEFELQLPPDEGEQLEKEPPRPFKCTSCKATFSTQQRLTSHTKTHADPLQCKKCEKKFKSPKTLDQHKCSFACKTCGKEFLRRDNLTQHTNYVHGKWKASELFTCDHCRRGFKYRKSLACHMKQHMEEKPLVCAICHEGFSVNNTFRQHMLTHGGKVPCKLCGKLLKPSALYYHVKQSHESARKFKCEDCGASFKTKSDLSGHEMIHEKKFVCHICEKRFSKKFKLKQHLLVHSNPSAFKCEVCDKNFTRKDSLEVHLRKIHGDSKRKMKDRAKRKGANKKLK